VKVRPFGDAALLVEPDEPAAVLPLARLLDGEPDVLEVVPGARTLLLRSSPAGVAALTERVLTLADTAPALVAPRGEEVVLDVVYDGADLEATAAELELSSAELVRRHAAGAYVVAFCGFAPGFAYLTGLDPALHVSRLAAPRTSVPAGAVGIAGEFTGVYPRSSPGGWRLLGRTDAILWDLERRPPALLVPGTPVRFRPR
jgi:KipI family sensor histidine kinase inhibitor